MRQSTPIQSWKKAGEGKYMVSWVRGRYCGVDRLTESRIEAHCRQAFCRVGKRIRSICTGSVVRWHQSEAEREPEGAERAEDDEWEGVANNPLGWVSIFFPLPSCSADCLPRQLSQGS